MVSNALTLLDNFNKLTPYAVGFDRVFDNLNRYVDNNVTSTGFRLTTFGRKVIITMSLKWHWRVSVKMISK